MPVSPVDRIVTPAIWVASALFFAAPIWSSRDWPLAARLMPQTVSMAGLVVLAFMAAATYLKVRTGDQFLHDRAHTESQALEGLTQRRSQRPGAEAEEARTGE